MSMPETDRPRGVQSVDRALDILELLAARPGTLGVTEIAREVGLPAGTTHRLLVALSARGWVRQDPGRRYGVGPAAQRGASRSRADRTILPGARRRRSRPPPRSARDGRSMWASPAINRSRRARQRRSCANWGRPA